MPARIVPATIADLFWLRMLLGQLVVEHGALAYPQTGPEDLEGYTATLASRLSADDPTLLCFVAEQDDAVVGFVLGNLLSRRGTPPTYCFVEYLYVAPKARVDGTGRALSGALISAARDRGAAAIEFLGTPADAQWMGRGWLPVALLYALPVNQALASLVPTRYANGHGAAPEPPPVDPPVE